MLCIIYVHICIIYVLYMYTYMIYIMGLKEVNEFITVKYLDLGETLMPTQWHETETNDSELRHFSPITCMWQRLKDRQAVEKIAWPKGNLSSLWLKHAGLGKEKAD